MARVTAQDMPADIRLALGDTLRNTDPATGTGLIIKIASRLSPRRPSYTGGPLEYFAANTGRWFRENWGSAVPSRHMHEFGAARRADVLESEFPPEFWYDAQPIEDVTELARPDWVLPARRSIDPAYWDAAHRPGNCPMIRIADIYPTPEGDGTSARPAPGWYGHVEDRVFRDLYQAQRRVLFALPRAHTPNTERPVAVRISASIDAEASHRGADAWFIIMSRAYWWDTYEGSPTAPAEVLNDWTTAQVVPFLLPGESAPPWSYSHPITIARNAEIGAGLDYMKSYNRLWVRLTTPPSLGRYFIRNDWVGVRVRSTINVFMARRPND